MPTGMTTPYQNFRELPALAMTDTKTLNRTAPTEKPAEPKRLFDMSASQLAGGALAAMTSAVIGAQLGVAGTVAGAAIGSIVAGVAGSLYTASIKRTKDKLSSAFVGHVDDTKVAVGSASDDTVSWEGWDLEAEQQSTAAAVAPPSPAPVAADALVDDGGKPKRHHPWKPILVSTVAVFLLAVAGITVFELVSGQAISGGQGTTITQVGDGESGSTDDEPTQAPTSPPSEETSAQPSSEPSSSASTEPSAEPSASTTEPSETAGPSTSSDPSTSASPGTASDELSAAGSGASGSGASGFNASGSSDAGAVAGG